MWFGRAVGRGALCAVFLAALAPSEAAAQAGTKAGVAAAVRGPVQQVSFRTPQATVGRNVGSGDEIFLGDRIVTGAQSGLQIMLLDGTTFSVGPNSSMVIDEFVFNPATGTGKIGASFTRGTLRVISGRIARQDEEAVRVKLPVATVGIRGTMAMFTGGSDGFFIGLFGVGPNNSGDRPQSYLTVGIGGTEYRIFRTGYGCTVTPAAPVCDPRPIGPEFLQQILGAVGGNLRQLDLAQFERLTGLDLFAALQLLQTQGGLEQFWSLIDNLFQDQTRPGSPPPSGPNCGFCCIGSVVGPAPQFADAQGRVRPAPRKAKRRQFAGC